MRNPFWYSQFKLGESEKAKDPTDGSPTDRPATTKGEQAIPLKAFRVSRPQPEITNKQIFHAWPKGNEAALVKLGLANDQERSIDIQILQTKPGNLTYSEAKAIQQGKNGPI